MKGLILGLWREEDAQDLVEYALLLVLISLTAVTSVKIVGAAVSNAMSNAASIMTTAT